MENKVIKRTGAYSKNEKQKSYSETLQSINGETSHSAGGSQQPYGFIFWLSVAASQVIGVTCVALAVYWGYLNEGFSFTNADQLFNYHPLFMILGLVVCYGDAILIYRVLSFLPKKLLKLVHGGLHVCAIIFSSIALFAMFENHRRKNRADLYSLHSWIGITTFAAFCLQYIGSFVTFLYPGLPANWRSKVMPFHLFFGLGLFIMAVATAEMGITEKVMWIDGYTLGKKVPAGIVGNSLGLLLMVFAILIVYITTHSAYKRKPLPND